MAVTDEEIRAKASDTIQARRDVATMEMKKKIAEVYSVCPQLSEVEQGLIASMKALCVLAIEGDSKAIQEIRAQVDDLRAQRKELLINIGLTDDIFIPEYTCKICEDTGFYENRRCECFKRLCEELATSELPQKLGITTADFESFNLEYYAYDQDVYSHMSKVLNASINYAENEAAYGKSLMLIGGTGVGKTHIALSIARLALKQNSVTRVRFTSAFAMCEAVECERYERRNPTKEQIRLAKDIFVVPLLIIDSLETLRDRDDDRSCEAVECERYERRNPTKEQIRLAKDIFVVPLLIIDSLETLRDRDDDRSVLFNLVDTRLTAGLATIITTSMSAGELRKRCGDMIYTKLESAYMVYNFMGKDIRLRLNSKSK